VEVSCDGAAEMMEGNKDADNVLPGKFPRM
jgi:hypothetical protein